MRDATTGRFVKAYNPFQGGRLVDEKMFDLSLETYDALNRALTQAESDVKRYDDIRT